MIIAKILKNSLLYYISLPIIIFSLSLHIIEYKRQQMKKLLTSLLLVLLVCTGVSGTAPAQSLSPHSGKTGAFIPPFSFKYGGVPSGKLLPRWKYSTFEMQAERDGEYVRSHVWKDPKSGLEVECRVKTFSDFDACEWVLYFRNNSDRDTPVLSEVKTVDLLQKSSAKNGEWVLFHARGAVAGGEDFRPLTTPLAIGQSETLFPDKGRSSSHTMPYFNLKTPEGGLVFAIGWTGQWLSRISRPALDCAKVEVGMQYFEAYLKPGEQIRQPSIVVLPWQGEDRMDGQNILRRLIMAHYHPLDASGEPQRVPIFNTLSNSSDPWPCDEYTCLTDYYAIMAIKRHQMFDTLADGFWIDAGWYSRARGWDKGYWWHNAVGNWTPDPDRFPDGMAPVADEVHKTGGRLMVWYEPERANIDSDWAHEHPEFMLAQDGCKAVPTDTPVDSAFIVNLGNPAALKWVSEMIVQSLTDGKIDCYRQDFNIDPLDFWINNDEPGRQGITEAHYIEGLYSYLDYLHAQLPFLMIDNCAGGGRRLDIEMARRSMPMWRDDFPSSGAYNQNYTYGLSQWLPVHCTSIGGRDKYRTLSAITAGGVFSWGINSSWITIPDQKRVIAMQREVAPYFLEEFYPLCGYEQDLVTEEINLGYQFNRTSDNSGLIFAFRRDKSESDFLAVRPRGLDPEKVYHLESAFDYANAKKGIGFAEHGLMPFTELQYPESPFQPVDLKGKEIMSGLTIPLPKKTSAALIKYTVVE